MICGVVYEDCFCTLKVVSVQHLHWSGPAKSSIGSCLLMSNCLIQQQRLQTSLGLMNCILFEVASYIVFHIGGEGAVHAGSSVQRDKNVFGHRTHSKMRNQASMNGVGRMHMPISEAVLFWHRLLPLPAGCFRTMIAWPASYRL